MQRQPSDPLSQRSNSVGGGGTGRRSDSSAKSGASASDAKSGWDTKSSASSSSDARGNSAAAAPGGMLNGLGGGSMANGATPDVQGDAAATAEPLFHLFAYPAESNFSGARYSPALAAAVRGRADCASALEPDPAADAAEVDSDSDPRQPADSTSEAPGAAGAAPEASASATTPAPGAPCPPCGDSPHRWLVALDAAKACATAPPDLRANPVDFVVSMLCFWR